MKYLIDTHILIWLAVSPEKISKSVLSILENPRNEIFVSTVSFRYPQQNNIANFQKKKSIKTPLTGF